MFNFSLKKMYLLIKKNFNHFIALLLLSISYFSSLLIFGEIVINPHDNLDITTVYDHIVSRLINGHKESLNIFLSGNFKWYYLDEILYPINIFHLFLEDKSFYFFEEILKKILSYFAFYILAKKFIKNRFYISIGAIVFTSIINMNIAPVGYGLVAMPYLLYIFSFKSLKLKYFLLIFIIALNSSLPHDYLSLAALLPVAYFFQKNKNKALIIFYYFVTLSAGIFISNSPLFFHFFSGVTIHRELFSIRVDFIESLKNLFALNGLNLFYLFLITTSLIFRDKNYFFLLVFIFFILMLKVIMGSNVVDFLLIKNFQFFKGLNFERVDRNLPLLFCLLLINNLSHLKNINFLKFFLVISLIYPIYMQLALTHKELIKLFLVQNLKQEKLFLLKSKIQSEEILDSIKIIYKKENYKDRNLIYKFKSKNTFEGYYRFSEYQKIKSIVGSNKLMSIGLDPMVAAMNNIKIIDGYHTIYSLEYKKRFRKIISKELDKNSDLKKYYDNWGSRLYAFYNDKNNVLINFTEAKNLGADYLLSSFPITNSKLETVCNTCNQNNDLYLYKIL